MVPALDDLQELGVAASHPVDEPMFPRDAALSPAGEAVPQGLGLAQTFEGIAADVPD